MRLLPALLLMLYLSTRFRVDEMLYRAWAIEDAAQTELERVVLITIDFHEDGFDPWAVYPFGLSCCHQPEWTSGQDAKRALWIFHEGRRLCRTVPAAFAFYNTGRCCDGRRPRARAARRLWLRGVRYGRMLSHTMERLLHLQWRN